MEDEEDLKVTELSPMKITSMEYADMKVKVEEEEELGTTGLTFGEDKCKIIKATEVPTYNLISSGDTNNQFIQKSSIEDYLQTIAQLEEKLEKSRDMNTMHEKQIEKDAKNKAKRLETSKAQKAEIKALTA